MIKNDYFISIIVPSLNNEATIEKCILSLLKQDYSSDCFEIIFVDNGSTDKTISIIKKYPVRFLMENIKNPYVSRNKGASCAKGQILVFTDARCEADQSWLTSINNFMNNNIDVSQGPGYLTNQKGLIPRAESERLAMDENYFWGDAKNLAIKMNVFHKVGGFFKYYTGSDSFLINHLKSLNYNVKYNKDQLVYSEFSEQFVVLLKKNWKYGKGDIIQDALGCNLRRYKKLKGMVLLIHTLITNSIKSHTCDDLLISIYIYLMSEIRYLSYFVNYNSVLKKFDMFEQMHAILKDQCVQSLSPNQDDRSD